MQLSYNVLGGKWSWEGFWQETIPQTFLSKRLWFPTEHLSYKDLWVLLFPEWYHAVLGLG